MKCPQCNNDFPLTWKLYAKTPFGRFSCPLCQTKLVCRHRWFYWPLVFCWFCFVGIPLAYLGGMYYGLVGVLSGWIIGGTLCGFPFDKYLEGKFSILKVNSNCSLAVKGEDMIRWKALIRDVIILFVLTFLVGVVIGMAAAGRKIPVVIIGASNMIFMVVGFTICGSMAKTNRFRHLAHVSVAVWLLSAFNMFFSNGSLVRWLSSIIGIAIAMFIGGGISYIFVRTPNEESCQPKPDDDDSKLAAP